MKMMSKVDVGLAPFRLKPWFSERVWGKKDLRPWYESTGTEELVGEAWLTGPACEVETGELAGRPLSVVAEEFGEELTGVPEGGEFPLLVKILFPNDKLSVQVHPDDAHAQAMGQAVVLPAKCGEVILKAEEHASFVLCAAQSGDPR